mgnify:CR=1 FL=1
MTPQPYNRLYQLTGTKGFANKYPIQGYALDAKQLSASGVEPQVDNLNTHSFLPKEEMEALVEKFQHPILKKYGEMAKEVGGHGGMDFIMDSRLVYCLQNGLPLDLDVYDLAEWCCLAELGELSMDNNCAAVEFPDFTRGEWNVIKGYKFAYASLEEEKETMDKAKAFTSKLKEWHCSSLNVNDGQCHFFLTGFVPSGTSFLLISYFQELFFHCFNTGETYLSVFYISFAVNNEVGRNT